LSGTDGELIQRTRDGDSQAFAELVERYRDAAYGTALHVLADPSAAAEVAQDAFFRAYRCLNQLRDPDRFSGWLYRIAMNLARNRLAHRRRIPTLASLADVPEPANPDRSAPKASEEAEVVGLIRQLMEELPDEQRLTFTLFYVNGYSHRDLSEMLDVPVGTIKSRLSNARSRLRKEVVTMAKRVLEEHKPDAEFWRSATGSATGRVTSAATGEPIEGANIRLYDPQTVIFASAESDADGVWKADELVPGAYTVRARHADYVEHTLRDEAWGQVRPSITVRPGQTVRSVDFSLEPGARIHGRVVGHDGTPVPDAAVSAWCREEPVHGEVRFVRAGTASTDDEGGFEITALPAGEYVIAAVAGGEDNWARFRPLTYHPGTFSLHDAEWMAAVPGEEPPEVPIKLADVGTASLTATVTDVETGEPIAGARLLIFRRDTLWDMFTGHTGEDGCFRSDLLTAGPWQIMAGAEGQGYARWSQWVDVAPQQDAVRLEFELLRGAVVEGRVETESGSALPSLDCFSCYFHPDRPDQELRGLPEHSAVMCMWGPSPATHSFTLEEGPQGEYADVGGDGHLVSPPIFPGRILICASVRDKAWRVVSASVAGEPLAGDWKVECEPGERIEDMEVVLGTNLGVVAGRVVSAADNVPVDGALVVFAPQDGDLASALPTETDGVGSFICHSVPAGTYVIAAKGSVEEAVSEQAKREIVVEPNGVVHLDLVLQER
jgi:RNA polymerase sigma-70 factor (ECF subfamily)